MMLIWTLFGLQGCTINMLIIGNLFINHQNKIHISMTALHFLIIYYRLFGLQKLSTLASLFAGLTLFGLIVGVFLN